MIKRIIFLLTFVAVLFATQAVFAQQTLQEGSWERIDYKVSGTWKIVQKSDGNYLVLDKQFKTKSGPDLHLLFSRKPIEQLTHSNARSNSSIIAELRSNREAQEYKIPANLNWQDYKAVIIHCVKFSHLWAGANFNP